AEAWKRNDPFSGLIAERAVRAAIPSGDSPSQSPLRGDSMAGGVRHRWSGPGSETGARRLDAEEARDALDAGGEVAGRRGRMVVGAGAAPARPRVDAVAVEAKRGVRRADGGPAGAGELAASDDVAVARRRVELREADERRRAGRRGEAGARAAARVGVVPEVSLQPRALACERQVVLARARDDELARLVVERLELVILRGPAEQLQRQHRDGGDDVARASPRDAARGLPAEREARRDADLLAEADLRNVAVERTRVEPIAVDELVERARGAQRAREHVTLRVGLHVVQLARLALERCHARRLDRDVELAKLGRLDPHRLDAGRR